ncbi:MAG: hypothetical protein AAFU85_23825 [Planctomycetota bacterium]
MHSYRWVLITLSVTFLLLILLRQPRIEVGSQHSVLMRGGNGFADSADDATIKSFYTLDGEDQATNDRLFRWSRLIEIPASGSVHAPRVADLELAGDPDAVALALTDRSESIRWLRLKSRQDPRPRIQQLRRTEDLIGVSLRGVELTASELVRLADATELRWLDIRYSRLIGEPAESTLEFSNVEVALLGNSEFPVETLAKMRFSKRLKTLGLTGSDITDMQLATVIARHGELRCLDLMSCHQLTSKSLEPLIELKRLEYLCIIDTPLVSFANSLSRDLNECVVRAID